MMAAIKAAMTYPSISTLKPETRRVYTALQVPEMIRVAAAYLKTGGSVAATHSWETTDADAKKSLQIILVKRVIDAYYPEAVCSPKGSMNIN